VWLHAASALGWPLEQVELKGADIYGGKNAFAKVAPQVRFEVLDLLFGALERHEIAILWEGVPKQEWARRIAAEGDPNLSRRTLDRMTLGFCSELHELLSAAYSTGKFLVLGDESEWVPAGKRVEVAGWDRMVRHSVHFVSSARTHGLQVADVVVHTLYRVNRGYLAEGHLRSQPATRGDKIAEDFPLRLARRGLLVNVTERLAQLSQA
jgi:hypothetical protein